LLTDTPWLPSFAHVAKDQSNSIVVFGDEFGLPVVLEVLREVLNKSPAACVIDPRRKTAQDWRTNHAGSLHILRHPQKSQRERFVGMIAGLNPALGIVFSYSRILWPELIDTFPLGIVNLHGGRLPEYRGANVLQWVIINGEAETAMTLHYVDAGIDTGPVIAELPVVIDDGDTAVTLREHSAQSAKTLLAEWLPRLIEGKVTARPQDESSARTWPRRKPEDGLIDFSWPDERIRNMTRALVKPWPGAHYFDRSGRKIIIDRALSREEVAALRREVHD
jgi:methionyl-tRNA formyltransferase